MTEDSKYCRLIVSKRAIFIKRNFGETFGTAAQVVIYYAVCTTHCIHTFLCTGTFSKCYQLINRVSRAVKGAAVKFQECCSYAPSFGQAPCGDGEKRGRLRSSRCLARSDSRGKRGNLRTTGRHGLEMRLVVRRHGAGCWTRT